jgi:SAM-dependent methyltransferase
VGWLRRLRRVLADRVLLREMERGAPIRDGDPVMIDLGCGKKKASGFVGIDRVALPGVDVVCDVMEQGIPFEDGTVDVVRAHDFLEHVSDPLAIMNEIYRVLKPNGLADLRVPSTDGRGAFQDPTHISFWNENSFGYYVEGYARDTLEYYGIKCRFVADELRTTRKDDSGVCWVVAKLRALKEGDA